MILRDIVQELDGPEIAGDLDQEIRGLAYDSRRARPGDLFFALAGMKQDGSRFVRDAVAAGAVAAVVSRDTAADGVPLVRVDEPRKALGQAAARFFGHPTRALQVVGVTGTNGKTTTTWLMESIGRAAGRRPGVIGTTGIRMDGTSRPSAFTTPEAPELQACLREMVERGLDTVALELSSHALVQHRTWGVECDVAVFTNLSRDHLDYHGTLDAYLDAKLVLFDGRNGPNGKRRFAVIGADDPVAPRVIEAARRGGYEIRRFGLADDPTLDVRVARVEPTAGGLALTLVESSAPSAHAVSLPLLGRYNAWNAAGAWAAARALGLPVDVVRRGLESVPAVPGRLERVDEGQPFQVVVDYAHTPDALERALAAAREHARGRVRVVFGCGGDRDRGKRPEMGRAARMGADRVWITSDNPRSEDPAAIAAEVAAGAGPGATVVLDRRDAIAKALAEAEPDDIVVIAGKGHETTQTIGDRVLPFDDREVAREVLRAPSARGR